MKAIRKDFKIEIEVRKMDKDELLHDGFTYYCEESGKIYREDELELLSEHLNK